MIDFVCPHCGGHFVVAKEELNCRIVRHFVYFSGEQLNPHASKEVCDLAVSSAKGHGCAGPVRLNQTPDGKWVAEKCDYI